MELYFQECCDQSHAGVVEALSNLPAAKSLHAHQLHHVLLFVVQRGGLRVLQILCKWHNVVPDPLSDDYIQVLMDAADAYRNRCDRTAAEMQEVLASLHNKSRVASFVSDMLLLQ